MTALGLDIGGSKLLMALVGDGRVTEEVQLETDLAEGPEGLLAKAQRAAAPWRGRFDRVGAAVTGIVRDGQWRALNTATLNLVAPFPLVAALERRFNCPCVALNDAQAAAWGEHRAGAGRHADIVFLTISTGLGGGVVLGGRLLGGLAGHFGQTRDEAGIRIEDRLAGRWFAEQARLQGEDAGAEQVFARAAEPWAAALIDTSVARAATLCGNIQLMLDPDRIVIGGGIGLARGYLDRLRRTLATRDLPRRPEIVPAALGRHAGVIGAADLASTRLASVTQKETAP